MFDIFAMFEASTSKNCLIHDCSKWIIRISVRLLWTLIRVARAIAAGVCRYLTVVAG